MDNKNDFYVVGIGASAGGLDAIQQLFDELPSNTGISFVIVQHLSPDFVSLMPELLGKHTKMKIFTAENDQVIEPNCIYLNQRNTNLLIKGKKLKLIEKKPKKVLNLPIDIFLQSLGEEIKDKSVAVIMSGTGSDGSRGIQSIKEHGGLIFVQDPTTTQFDGMPKSAIATNLVDFISNPEQIAKGIIKLTEDRNLLESEKASNLSQDVLFQNILDEIYKHSSIDFRSYKKNTLERRLEKRIKIHNIDNLYDYLTLLKSSFAEKDAITNDFLIGVTQFFRDKEAFNILKKEVIPELCRNRVENEVIRIWTAGCSTGQETYSIAILIDDYITKNNLKIGYKIFATDIKPENIQTASSGAYLINYANEIEEEHLENYFSISNDRIRINKEIRENVVFSAHSLLTDPPFIKMDFVVCRNLLIYLDTKSQLKILEDFHFSLNKNGYLFLGNSESLSDLGKYFKVIDPKWKIYQNVVNSRFNPYKFGPPNQLRSVPMQSDFLGNRRYTDPSTLPERQEFVFYEYLSKKFSPTSLFIDKEYNILFIVGDAGRRLSHKEGLFFNNLLKVVDSEIALIIRNGIRKLEKDGKDILIKNVIQTNSKDSNSFDLILSKPIGDNLKDTYFIQFTDNLRLGETPNELKEFKIDNLSKQRVDELEHELKVVKSELQNAIEELETSNEELQSANEELMASNEELQSTNEELQSVNEELYTVNSEMQEKNKELFLMNNDINNLLESTQIATLFLNKNLRIRRYTPKLKSLFNLEESDIGRPIANFSSNLDPADHHKMLDCIQRTLETLNSVQYEIKDKDGHHYLLKISPFISSNLKLDGIVISYIDIHDLKTFEEDLKQKTSILEATLTPMMVSNFKNGDLLYYNKSFMDLIETKEINENANTNNIYVDPDLRKKKIQEISKAGSMKQTEFEIKTAKGNRKWVLESNDVIEYDGKKALFASLIDNTTQKNLEFQLRKSETNLKTAVRSLENYNRTLVSVTSMLNAYLAKKDKEKVFEVVLNNLLDLTSCDFGFIGDVKTRDDAPYITMTAISDISWDKKSKEMYNDHKKNSMEFSNLNSLYGMVLTSGELYISNDAANDPNKFGTPNGHLKIDSFCGIPLKVGEKLVGMIGLANRPGGFSKDIIDELNIYILACAQLIENFNDWNLRIQLQQKAESIAQELQLFIETANAPIFGIDTQGRVNEWNETAEKITGFSKSEVLGQNLVKEYISEKYEKSVDKVLKLALKGTGTSNFEFPLTTKEGNEIMVLLNSTTRRDARRNIIGVIGVGQDITEINKYKENLEFQVQKRTQELEDSLEKQKELNILKTRFVAMASHEFRTPLTAIKTTSEVILKYFNKLEKNQIEERLLKINSEVDDLTSIIEDVLILGKSDAKKLEFKGILVDLSDVVKINMEEYCVSNHSRKITFKKGKGDFKMEVDPLWIKHIIYNLLSNACKYSPVDKEVLIKITDESNQIRISVTDHGIGIAKKDQTILFDAFHRGINVGGISGTGLGLAVVKKAVDLHRGSIEVESKLNIGSTFHIILPKN